MLIFFMPYIVHRSIIMHERKAWGNTVAYDGDGQSTHT